MSKFVQKDIPEGINTSKESPLKDFIGMAGVIVITVAGLFLLLTVASIYLGKNISFKQEQDIFEKLQKVSLTKALKLEKPSKNNPDLTPLESQLQALVDELWQPFNDQKDKVQLPVSILQMKAPNAFMGPGGRMTLTTGFLKEAQSENELSFVICHEIGHFYLRHIIQGMSRGIGMQLLLSMIGLESVGGGFLSTGVGLADRSFGREDESKADALGLKCLNNKYGHLNGGDAFFRRMGKKHESIPGKKILSYISTHPMSDVRIQDMKSLAKKNNWKFEGTITSLQYDKSLLN